MSSLKPIETLRANTTKLQLHFRNINKIKGTHFTTYTRAKLKLIGSRDLLTDVIHEAPCRL